MGLNNSVKITRKENRALEWARICFDKSSRAQEIKRKYQIKKVSDKLDVKL